MSGERGPRFLVTGHEIPYARHRRQIPNPAGSSPASPVGLRNRRISEAMPSKKSLTVENLEALGARRLAELLIETSTGHAAIKRRLRLELAKELSPAAVAREIRKRLATIRRSRTFVDWQNRKALTDDLETQRRAIVEEVTPENPADALDLMWRFLDLANSVFARCDDGSGRVIEVFHRACEDLGDIAEKANALPTELSERAFEAIKANDYGQYDYLIAIMAPALGEEGLAHLKKSLKALSGEAVPTLPQGERKIIGWGSDAVLYADQVESNRREHTIRFGLRQIADAEGDVDAFIAQYDRKVRAVPAVAAMIGQRLLAAGRLEEAWEAINSIDAEDSRWIPIEWEHVRLAIMEARGQGEEAQQFRWACFERSLSAEHLKTYLKRLPEFAEMEAEEKALSLAQRYPEVHRALAFLISWPALEKAAELVQERQAEIDGDHYELLAAAAEALTEKHPLAATILLRAMIDFALNTARIKRYPHAARHLIECGRLANRIEDFAGLESHERYVARLRNDHGRKTSFWSKVR